MELIVVTPSSFGQCGREPLKMLKEFGYEVIKNPYGRRLTEEETIELGKNAIGIVAGVERYNKQVLDELDALKCISRVGVGLDGIDLDYANSKGIKVVNTPNGPTPAVAELSVALAFDLLRGVSYSDRAIRNGRWEKSIGRLINAKRVGIVGLGRIGKATAKLYQALGCEVFACDLYPDIDWMEENSVSLKELDELLKESEIISLHVSSSSDGKPLIGEKELLLLQSEAILINLARGGVVDEGALFDFLTNNPQNSVALDVFKKEPYQGPFTKLDNVILTPHLGSYAREAKLDMEVQSVKNLIKELS